MIGLIIPITDFTLEFILISGIVLSLEIFMILYFISFYWWKRKGQEIFILYPNSLEYIQTNKPFKSSKWVVNFKQMQFCYQSEEDFESEEEAKLLGVELDIDKVEGNYPIQFYMNDGEQVINSEREIPIEVIRRIKLEFLKLNENNL
ncbi:hypothetical protein JGH11_03245 [Dysgonomonas sp. Marseille-P4677]|uniref:hypothetical protein n=1 Tax=Dysgonomonas sp. Marseille-P4677 TaxID=2364790 RepID=UPI001A560EEF|nr:hypothetical protein [Dysgonomonas sp. Marseille-P4677]MBK5719879.1 hypothetical protein [Dysgonomonas sp. Marseille-P4677]